MKNVISFSLPPDPVGDPWSLGVVMKRAFPEDIMDSMHPACPAIGLLLEEELGVQLSGISCTCNFRHEFLDRRKFSLDASQEISFVVSGETFE